MNESIREQDPKRMIAAWEVAADFADSNLTKNIGVNAGGFVTGYILDCPPDTWRSLLLNPVLDVYCCWAHIKCATTEATAVFKNLEHFPTMGWFSATMGPGAAGDNDNGYITIFAKDETTAREIIELAVFPLTKTCSVLLRSSVDGAPPFTSVASMSR